MSSLKARLFRTCPKSGRIIGVRQPEGWARVFFPLVGLAALAWFLLRVVPKPSRAAYPCQRVAMPLASGFVLWLAGMAGAGLAIGGARRQFRQARWLSGGLAVVIALVGVTWAAVSVQNASLASALPERVEYTPHPANQPIGVAKGLAPGRVAWAYEPSVTVWNGTSYAAGQRWYDQVSQPKAGDLMEWALTGYAGAGTSSAAWDAIFRHFNGGAPYQAGEKVFIKINLTTSYSNGCADSNYNWTITCLGGGSNTGWTYIGQSPQLMIALLDQLVNVAGVAQSDITIGDSTGLWVNELYNPVHSAFPNVRYMDARGGMGRTAATRSNVPLHWSTSEANGKSQDYILQAVADAKYVIDLAILKAHERNGITVTAKNHFGSLSGGNTTERKPTSTNYYNLHSRLPLETQAPVWPDRGLMAQYRPLVDLNGHAQMGGKTLLYMVDAIYGGKGWAGVPYKWTMSPFNGQWPASLFISMDQVAIDSVGFDFLSQQWPDLALGNEGVQDYLHEMALADNPPSGTFYDPEHDGVRLASQGVHEHWNNPVDKQYSRNLGTGNGIELVQVRRAEACGVQSVLFVSATNPATASDQVLVDRLSSAGYSVTVRNQTETSALDALSKDLVIISESVTSTSVNTKFRDVMIPVINWEPSLFDDMMMTGATSGTDYGDLANQTQLNIVNASHPLASDLSAGLVTTTSSQQLYFWGAPSADAAIVATLNGFPTRAAIFGYEEGATMAGMKAPARRVGFFNGIGSAFTADGWALYDAAVKWALQCGSVSGGFLLIDADTSAVLGSLTDGINLELTTLPPNLAIRAVTDPGRAGSVQFIYDGQAIVDNTPHYEFSGLPLEWTPGVGAHTISAQPFSRSNAGGVAGQGITVNYTVTNTPLAVTLASFDAVQQGEAVQVSWETVSELGNRGFNLHRGASPAGPDRQLNTALIPSQAPGSPGGFVYTWQDRADLVPGTTYYYWVEDVDASGVVTRHGPVSVDFATPTAVTLSSMEASPAAGATALPALWMAVAAGAALGLAWLRRRA